ncbi:MAG: hypothetical protein KC415_07510 [Anaerolineales bacterium]|nr:hypothetical protein [Anaerolineales bacterium]MCB9003507.1 hypothetical protein [Ardenticatenaceae bacterium]
MKQKVVWITFLSLLLIIGTGLVLAYQIKSKRVAEEKERVAQERELLNQIFFSGADCTAPCWQGLVPGQSGSNEYRILAQKLKEDDVTFRSEDIGDDYTVYSWFDSENEVYFYIYFDVIGQLHTIFFSGLNITNIGSLFTLLGEPDYYASKYIQDIETVITLEFLYVDEGAVVIFKGVRPNQETNDCYLDPSNLSIRQVSLVSSSNPLNMLADSFRKYYSSFDPIQPWAGIEAIRIHGCVPKQ